jgi:hypothetical protein
MCFSLQVSRAEEALIPDIAIGPWYLEPSLQAAIMHDSNLFYDEKTESSDSLQRLSPQLQAGYKGDTVHAKLDGRYEHTDYRHFDAEDYELWHIKGQGEYQPEAGWRLGLKGQGNRQAASRDSLTGVARGARVFFREQSAALFIERQEKERGWFAYAQGEGHQRQFEVAPGRDYTQFNRTGWRTEARLGHRFTPDTAIFVQPAYSRFDFAFPSAAGFNRDSRMLEVALGMDITQPELWQFDALVGLQKLNQKDAGRQEPTLWFVKADWQWTPLEQLAVDVRLGHDLVLPDRVQNLEAERIHMALTLNYKPDEFWIFRASPEWQDVDFYGSTQDDFQQHQLMAGMYYDWHPSVRLGAEAYEIERSSNNPGDSFSVRRVALGLQLGL